MKYDLSLMRSGVLPSRKCYGIQTRAFILTITWLALLIIFGMGEAANTAQAQTPPRIYVVDCLSQVIVLDLATNAPVAAVLVGFDAQAIALTPDGSRAYVVHSARPLMEIIDTATLTVITTVTIPPTTDIAITPDGKRAYLVHAFTPNQTVSVFDLATNTVSAVVPFDGITSRHLAMTRDGSRVYVLAASDKVLAIDTATNAVIATITVGVFPSDLAITPDGRHVYVTNGSPSSISVIDTATNTVSATIPFNLGDELGAIAITPDGSRAYALNPSSNKAIVINTATNSIVTTIPVGNASADVAITPDGSRAYVANANDGTLSVINTATNTVTATVNEHGCPQYIAFTPAPRVPMNKDECKNGGYRNFGPPAGPFRNQGQCVSYVESHSHR